MYCKACGKELKEGAKFCPSCGTATPSVSAQAHIPQQPTVSEASTGQSIPDVSVATAVPAKSKKRIIIPIVSAVVALAIVVFGINLIMGLVTGSSPISLTNNVINGFEYKKSSVQVFYSADKDKSYFVVDGTALNDTIDSAAWYGGQSLDGSKVFILNNDQNGYLVSAQGVRKIAGTVSMGALSPDGSKGAYLDAETGIIYLFDTSGGATQKIDVSYGSEYSGQYIFSPNADTFVYAVAIKTSNSSSYSSSSSYSYELRVYRNGSSTTIGKNLIPISVSNGGEYIYCYNSDNYSLYCANAQTGNLDKLASDYIGYGAIVNTDSTEIVFSTKSGIYYVEKNGEKVKLRDEQSCGIVFPENAVRAKSLKKQVYFANGTLFYLDENLEATRFATDVSTYEMSYDLQTVYYTKSLNNSLYRADIGSDKDPEKLATDISVYYLAVSKDQKQIYYIDTDGSLRYIVSDTESQRIASDASSLCFADDGKLYFQTGTSRTGQSVKYTQNGGDAVIVNNDTFYLFKSGNDIYFAQGEYTDYNLYIMKNGQPNKLLGGLYSWGE